MTSKLFRPARNESAFLKLGLMGAAGSGKTFTAAMVAIGLVQLARERELPYASKPVMFLDSENGSDYLIELFEEAGIELLVAKTKSFADLCAGIGEAEKHASLLILDSVSAFWEEWKSTYQKEKGRGRLSIDDIGAIKSKWREGFTDRFINSRLHVIMCGRLAYEYDFTVDEAGKKQLEKTDVKMAAEKELGYETSLYVLMERDTDMRTMQMVRNATVLKDRFRTLDGKTFQNPSFKTFAPHILKLNLAGEHNGIDLSRTSASLVPSDPKRENYAIRRKIVVDEIDALLAEHGLSGQAADVKARRAALVKEHFHTVSRTEIEELMSLVDLQAHFDSLHRALTGAPSRYGQRVAPAAAVTDDIPFAGDDPGPQPAPATDAAAPSPAAASSPPAASASEAQPAGPDMRDATMQRIIAAIGKAANPTQLSAVIKCNAKARAALDDERNALIDIAAGERRTALKLAAAAA